MPHAEEGRAGEVENAGVRRWEAWVLSRARMPGSSARAAARRLSGDLLVLARGREGSGRSRTQTWRPSRCQAFHGS